MPYENGYIWDKDLNELYVSDQDQCERCANKAEINGLCLECWEEDQSKQME